MLGLGSEVHHPHQVLGLKVMGSLLRLTRFGNLTWYWDLRFRASIVEGSKSKLTS